MKKIIFCKSFYKCNSELNILLNICNLFSVINSYYNRSEFLGVPGMVTITHPDSEGFTRIAVATESVHTVLQDTVDGCGKRFFEQKQIMTACGI